MANRSLPNRPCGLPGAAWAPCARGEQALSDCPAAAVGIAHPKEYPYDPFD